MTDPIIATVVIVVVTAVVLWLWDDLTEELRIHLDQDAPNMRRDHPNIKSLVTISDGDLVTPRGVVIPPGWLNGDLDLDDALDWLDYVEALG